MDSMPPNSHGSLDEQISQLMQWKPLSEQEETDAEARSFAWSLSANAWYSLTGQRALDTNRPSGQHSLTEWVKPYLHDRRKLKGIMDPRLGGKFPSKAAFRIAQLSLKCLASEPKQRPSMKEVLENLERIQAVNEKPVEPKFRSTHAASLQGHQAVHHRSPHQDGSY